MSFRAAGVNFYAREAGVWVIDPSVSETDASVSGAADGESGTAAGERTLHDGESSAEAGIRLTGANIVVVGSNDFRTGGSLGVPGDSIQLLGDGAFGAGPRCRRGRCRHLRRGDNLGGARSVESLPRVSDSDGGSGVLAPGSTAPASGTNDSATGSSNCDTGGNIDGSGTIVYTSHTNVCVTGTDGRLPTAIDSGIDRRVSQSSTNAAERDDNISDLDTNERKRHGRRPD